jgi:hypothetical protein
MQQLRLTRFLERYRGSGVRRLAESFTRLCAIRSASQWRNLSHYCYRFDWSLYHSHGTYAARGSHHVVGRR